MVISRKNDCNWQGGKFSSTKTLPVCTREWSLRRKNRSNKRLFWGTRIIQLFENGLNTGETLNEVLRNGSVFIEKSVFIKKINEKELKISAYIMEDCWNKSFTIKKKIPRKNKSAFHLDLDLDLEYAYLLSLSWTIFEIVFLRLRYNSSKPNSYFTLKKK